MIAPRRAVGRLAAGLAVVLGLSAGPAAAERLPVRAFTSADGIANDWVKRVVRDSRGFLWLCTEGGLVRFDGARFVNYGVADGMPNAALNDLLEARDGTYWIASNGGGLYRFSPTGRARFSVHRVAEEAATNRINDLLQDRAGAIWLGTDGGLFRLEGDASRSFVARRVPLDVPGVAELQLNVRALVEDGDGSLWAATSAGLVRRLLEGSVIRHAVAPGPVGDLVSALALDTRGRLFAAHASGVVVIVPSTGGLDAAGGLRIRDAGEGEPPATRPGDASRHAMAAEGLLRGARCLHASRDGRVWVASSRGLAVLEDERFRSVLRLASARDTWVLGLGEDMEGNVWFGTNGNGVLRLAQAGFVSYGSEDGLRGSYVDSLSEHDAGRIYLATLEGFLHRWDGGRFTAVRPTHVAPTPESDVTSRMLRDHRGAWWISSPAGLLRFPPVARIEALAGLEPSAVYPPGEELPLGAATTLLFEDSRRNVWVSGARVRHTLARWERSSGRIHRFGGSGGLPAFARVTSIAEDRAGNVWLGLWDGGVARHREGRLTVLTENGAPKGPVRALHVDGRGGLWLSSSSEGLFRVADPSAARPRFEIVLPLLELGTAATCFVEDRFGRLYVGTAQGVVRLDERARPQARYGMAEGLAAGRVVSALRAADGTLWFGTVNGVSRLLPVPDQPRPAPPVFVSGVSIAGVARVVSELGEDSIEGLVLEPDERSLRIEFLGLAFRPGSILRYQYRLESTDADWSPPSEERSVTYAGLGPGRYRFVVRGVTPDGQVSRDSASVEFAVLPPFWRRGWFAALVVVAVALAGVGLHRYRLARLLALERVRTRIAGDLHDDIGTNLSQIAILSEVARRRLDGAAPGPDDLLERIGMLSRESVDAMGDIVWAVDPRQDRVGSLAQRMRRLAADRLAGSGVELRFEAAADQETPIRADARRQVFLAFKEGLSNALRHSGCRTLVIELRILDGQLTLQLRDDGRGFDVLSRGDGHGLHSMRRRAEGLGGSLDVASEAGRGTSLAIRVPLERARATP